MKNTFYFPHDYDASTDRKIVKLRTKFGWKGYGVYWAIIEALAREDGYMDRGGIGVAIGDVTTDPIIDYCLEIDLLGKNEEELFSHRLLEHIKIRQKFIKAGKRGAKKRWGNTQVEDSPPIDHAISPPNSRKGKERKEKKNNTIPFNNSLEKYIETFKEYFGSNHRPTTGRGKKLKSRLQIYKLKQILEALKNLSASDFHTGKNDRGWKADPDFLIRNDEQVDKWLNQPSEKKVNKKIIIKLPGE